MSSANLRKINPEVDTIFNIFIYSELWVNSKMSMKTLWYQHKVYIYNFIKYLKTVKMQFDKVLYRQKQTNRINNNSKQKPITYAELKAEEKIML